MGRQLYENPRDPKEWGSLVVDKLDKQPSEVALGDIIKWQSGSRLEEHHFLHLKILWKEIKSSRQFALERYVDREVLDTVSPLCKTKACIKFYNAVGQQQSKTQGYGENSIFDLVKFYIDLVRNIKEPEVGTLGSPKVFLRPRSADTYGGKKYLEAGDAASGSSTHKTPLPEGSSPTAANQQPGDRQDENIVNMHLILLLNAVTERTAEVRRNGYQWKPERAGFTINDNRDPLILESLKSDDQQLLTAHVDGHLADERGLSAAIVEVKPVLRGYDKKRQRIEWQEGAQMCASICELIRRGVEDSGFGLLKSTNPRVKRSVLSFFISVFSWPFGKPSVLLTVCIRIDFSRRLLISQDYDEVYITIAEYDGRYVTYLRGPEPAAVSPFRQPNFQRGINSRVEVSKRTPEVSSESSSQTAPDDSPLAGVRGGGVRTPKQIGRDSMGQITTMMQRIHLGKKTNKGKGRDERPEQQLEQQEQEQQQARASGFMEMHCFGPWVIYQKDDMHSLCKTLFALSLQLSLFGSVSSLLEH